MCGITGIYYFNGQRPLEKNLSAMNDTMRLRGPDDSGIFIDGSVGMAMRRLAIIDQITGHQPITNENGQIHIVFNGEIYNYIELKAELESDGHLFSTNSDTEVLVHLYEKYGLDSVHKLIGMFAFSIYDSSRNLVWLVRDRLGVKPLFYARKNNFIAWGSTIDALCQLPEVSKEIDEESILLFLTLAYIPNPGSIIKGILKLPPGCWMTVYQDGSVNLKKYWEIEQKNNMLSADEFVQEGQRIITESIELHSRADVSVGCYLSGGVDSSIVTALYCKRSSHPVHTFNVHFEGKQINELPYAKEVANKFNTIHHSYLLSQIESLSKLEALVPLMDEPVADSAIVPSYILSKRAREHGIIVMLSGAGGDEIFGGYSRHYQDGMNRFAGSLPFLSSSLLKIIGRFISPQIYQDGLRLADSRLHFALATSGVHMGIFDLLLREKKKTDRALNLLTEKFNLLHIKESQVGFSYSRMIADIQNYLVDNVLSFLDKTSMATSIEGRVPLLDHRLVELAFSVPEQINIAESFASSKRTLKRIGLDFLPASILERKKVGFNAPVDQWIKMAGDNPIFSRLKKPKSRLVSEWLKPDVISQIEGNSKLRFLASENLFIFYILDIWLQHHE